MTTERWMTRLSQRAWNAAPGLQKQSGYAPRSAPRLRRFNIVGRPCSNRARVCRSRQRHRDRFPGSNGLDDDVDPGQGAFDFSLHALNLALQECLQLLELGREPFESLYRICSQPDDRGLEIGRAAEG